LALFFLSLLGEGLFDGTSKMEGVQEKMEIQNKQERRTEVEIGERNLNCASIDKMSAKIITK